ncbi:MAG: hypothetical protein JWP89_1387 [Schlesneria sp.]|nr:hypothetical protein [Schlesneria sp.]
MYFAYSGTACAPAFMRTVDSTTHFWSVSTHCGRFRLIGRIRRDLNLLMSSRRSGADSFVIEDYQPLQQVHSTSRLPVFDNANST